MHKIFFPLFLRNMFRFLFFTLFVIHYLDLGDCLSLTCELCCCVCLAFISTSMLQLLFIHNVVLYWTHVPSNKCEKKMVHV
jgi:hypothetical protein